jgi:hypothetical protein
MQDLIVTTRYWHRLEDGRLQVLPELGYEQITRNGHAGRRRLASKACQGCQGTLLPERGLH